MQTGTLAICDLDEEYGKRLMEYISNKQGMPFKVVVFTDKGELLRYVKEHYVEILLIADKAMEEDMDLQNVGKVILLSPGEILAKHIDYDSIFKYQSGDNIVREVLEYYVEMHKGSVVPISKGGVEIIGVYSPVGRTGKTTFALTLGQVLASDNSVIYINMEEFSAFEKIFGQSYGGDLSDLMYYFKQNPEVLPIKLQAIVGNVHGLDYVPPLKFCEDLRNLETKEWISLIKKIATTGTYDKIILDLSNMVRNIFGMLDICDVIYMPINDDQISLMKVNAFEECVLKSEKEKLLDCTVKIKLPHTGRQTWEEDYLEKQLWGELGDFVRKIIKEEAA